jgi:hypothetical protein
MTVNQIIEMLQNRIVHLSQARSGAAALGDLARVAALDEDLAETELTLATLRAANN